MGNLFISIAHSKHSPGVMLAGSHITEYEMAIRQSNFVADDLRLRGHNVMIMDFNQPVDRYRYSKPDAANSSGPWDLLLEMHHNSSISTIQYGMVIYYHTSIKGKKAATNITKQLKNIMPWKVYNPRGHICLDISRMWWLTKTKYPSIITEPGFFSHSEGLTPHGSCWYLSDDNVYKEALAIANGIHNYFTEEKERI